MAAELPELAHWHGLSSFRACLLLLFCPSHRFLPDQEFEVLFVVCSSPLQRRGFLIFASYDPSLRPSSMINWKVCTLRVGDTFTQFIRRMLRACSHARVVDTRVDVNSLSPLIPDRY